jgi:lipid II:glycine glycyltransferase (peptidoglycan interpeptide bridge formation enzyme)
LFIKEIDIHTYSDKGLAHIGVFGSSQWLEIYNSNLKVCGIFNKEEKIIGGFFYYVSKKAGFTFFKLPPYTPHCGLFFVSDTKNRSSRSSFIKEITALVSDYFESKKQALTVIAFPTEIMDMQPFIWSNYKVIPNYTYRIDLSQSFDDIKSNFDPKNRNVIAKALKEGVEVRKNALNKNDLIDFFTSSLKQAGANIYPTELRNIFLKFSSTENSFCLSAFKENQLCGNVFCIYDRNTCYYLLGGVVKSVSVNGVNNLLIEHSIREAQLLNCKVFDFEGSMLKGVEKFFRSFGPELVPFYTANKGKLPLELLLKFKKPNIF